MAGGDFRDVACLPATSGRDVLTDLVHGRFALALHGLDRRPPDQRAAFLADVSAPQG